jgi:transcription elongation factor GreA
MPTPISKEGYEKLKAELDQLEKVELPKVSRAVAEARAEGDLKENAEYHAQRENMSLLNERIGRLNSRLAESYIVDKDTLPKDKVVFGRKVTLRDLNEDLEEDFELVGPGEEDYTGAVMKILSTSPLAQQLLNHKVGDKVEVDTPAGKVSYEVVAIE